jgi:hypothetical protein
MFTVLGNFHHRLDCKRVMERFRSSPTHSITAIFEPKMDRPTGTARSLRLSESWLTNDWDRQIGFCSKILFARFLAFFSVSSLFFLSKTTLSIWLMNLISLWTEREEQEVWNFLWTADFKKSVTGTFTYVWTIDWFTNIGDFTQREKTRMNSKQTTKSARALIVRQLFSCFSRC